MNESTHYEPPQKYAEDSVRDGQYVLETVGDEWIASDTVMEVEQ